ncbi:hypothetical protein QQ045_007445 [Rhodiola kirilowii]
MCTEWLSSKLYHLYITKALSGIRVARNVPFISHLFFADDSILYFRADETTPPVLEKLLQDYEAASGQADSSYCHTNGNFKWTPGMFTTKSAYQLAYHIYKTDFSDTCESSDATNIRAFWRLL